MGDVKTISKLEKKDFLDYWRKYILSDASMIAVSGGVKLKEIIESSETTFAKANIQKKVKIPKFDYKQSGNVIMEYKDLPQTSMLLSFRTKGGKPDAEFRSLLVLRAIMALGYSSVIVKRLRVKESLIYGWASNLIRYFDTGSLNFILSTSTNQVSRMLSILSEEIQNLMLKGIDQNTLDLYKGFIEGDMYTNLETSEDFLEYYAQNELYYPGRYESVEERVNLIKNLTVDDINRVIKKYLTRNNWSLSVVGRNSLKDIKFEV